MTVHKELESAVQPLARSNKIATRHLARLAIVYVRQSSARQVKENVESTRLQYDLVNRAEAYGLALRVVAVTLAGGQEAEVDRCRSAAAVAPAEQPVASQTDAAQRVLRRVVIDV